VKEFTNDDRPLLLKNVGYATIGDSLIINPSYQKDMKNLDSDTHNWRVIESIIKKVV
jgi:hypothetical protein